ncbi:hypothetical protein NTE_01213 [Candidatus Nitrososphaera evergladensis SR1]|uniref:Uncharacterized protein n=1 Tax=Candidatus Nitrososphaera evergladensis SR1 TaxID=1459636 RepID=A0A075MQD2_9ARCH|nr:hypothetical protein [Candidatus Nitrososphaera evergladensis]AIF83285.1 hypothetical protein NTE_01213 [Candidatus Nitrososphaera evergladensis SR1]
MSGQRVEDSKENSNKEKISLEKELFDHAKSLVGQSFKDDFGRAYIEIVVDGHTEIVAIESQDFKHFLSREFQNHKDMLISEELVRKIQFNMVSQALYSKNKRKLYVRLAQEDNAIYYDLCNDNWEVVKITSKGWEILGSGLSSPQKMIFKRNNNNRPQVYPSRTYRPTILADYIGLLNIKDEDQRVLVESYLISLFVENISHAAISPYGEWGTAKSTFCKLLKRVVDPATVELWKLSKKEEDTIQQLSHNYLLFYDNLSGINESTSDLFCQAITGAGFGKRKHYENDEDFLYNFKRCIGFNGIGQVASKGDLLERSIPIELAAIEKRKSDEEIDNRVRELMPELLGYLFDTLVKYLQEKEKGGIKLSKEFRMKDFAEACEIISRKIGYAEDVFTNAYSRIVDLQTELAIESNPVAQVITLLMENNKNVEDTPTKLKNRLDGIAETSGINVKDKTLWPQNLKAMSLKIKESAPNLRKLGIEVQIDRSSARRRILITKVI